MHRLLLIAVVLLLPACSAVRQQFLQDQSRNLLHLPNATVASTRIDPFYTGASVTVRYSCPGTPAQVWTACEKELARKGFKPHQQADGDPVNRDAPAEGLHWSRFQAFTRGDHILWGEWLTLYVRSSSTDGRCFVEASVRYNSYLGEFAKAPIQVPCALLLMPAILLNFDDGSLVYYCSSFVINCLY